MKESFITTNFRQTQKLGEILAKKLKGEEVVCLSGELGSGKTTFAQGMLKGLGAKGPFTSPTFVVMKEYRITHNAKRKTSPQPSPLHTGGQAYQGEGDETQNIYHIDAYRVGSKDISDLGWEEIISDKKNIVIVEWAERIKSIVPKKAVWISFEHVNNDERKIITKR